MAAENNPNRKRSKIWTDEETDALIAIWNEDNILDQISRKTTAKKPVWGEMAVSLHDLSVLSQTGEQIKTKVHDLSAAYKDIVDLVKPSGAGTEV